RPIIDVLLCRSLRGSADRVCGRGRPATRRPGRGTDRRRPHTGRGRGARRVPPAPRATGETMNIHPQHRAIAAAISAGVPVHIEGNPGEAKTATLEDWGTRWGRHVEV